jgi:hypothetical protein
MKSSREGALRVRRMLPVNGTRVQYLDQRASFACNTAIAATAVVALFLVYHHKHHDVEKDADTQ